MKEKRKGVGLQMRSFTGNDGKQYLVFRTPPGAFHVFKEVEAKQAARECMADPLREDEVRDLISQPEARIVLARRTKAS